MIFDAIVLAGGRSSRLDGVDKTTLEVDGRSLLDRAVDAAVGARRVIVVGPEPRIECPDGERYAVVREEPPFGGPAAGLAAGLTALDSDSEDSASRRARSAADFVLVLAGDLPFARPAVDGLLASAGLMSAETDGVIAIDSNGRRQYLTALYRSDVLASRCAATDLRGSSMRALLDGLTLVDVPAPPGSTEDVDTWIDAERIGASRKAHG